MKHRLVRYGVLIGLAVAGWLWNGEIRPNSNGFLGTVAEAIIGRPLTPVSYAGVARRSTVGVGAPGVGVIPGVGLGAPGVGIAPGPGVLPVNRGGPVNRVGVR